MTLNNTHVIDRINPRLMAAYLTAKGWTLEEKGASQVWTHGESPSKGGEASAQITIDTANPEQSLQIEQAITQLEKSEDRPARLIVLEMGYADADIVRVTVHDADTADSSDHTLGLENSVRLVQGLQRSLAAACWATLSPSPNLSGKKPPQVGQYVRNVRVGAWVEDGYGQAAYSPLQEIDQETLARRTMLTLANALDALKRLAARPSLLRDTDFRGQMIEHGVSANLCDAFSLMFGKLGSQKKQQKQQKQRSKAGAGSGVSLEISFVWSPLLAAPKDTPSEMIFETEVVPVLQDLSGALRETTPKENFQLTGMVTDLRRSGQTGTGKIAVSNVTREEPEKVTLELEDDLYEVAIQAHRDKAQILCVGTLVKNNKSYELVNASLSPAQT